MKKIFKRTSAIAVSAFMLSQMVPYAVFADPATGSNTLAIHPYVLSDANYEAAEASDYVPTGTLADATTAQSYGQSEEANITFDIVEVNANGEEISGGYSSGENPAKTFSNLPDGYYKVTPHNSNTDSNFRTVEAFYVQLVASSGSDDNTVHVYPKLTDNDEAGDPKDPSVPDPDNPNPDPDNPITANKHAIKLTKTLQGSNTWDAEDEATFAVYFENALNKWEKIDDFSTTDGVLLLDGLPLGDYYAYEIDAPTGYLKDQKPMKFTVDGSGEINKLTASFVNDKLLTATKEIAMDGEGDDYNWVITTTIPTKTENLMSYTVTDTYTEVLDNVSVTSVEVDSTPVAASKYSIDTTQNGQVIVEITDMSALAGGDELTIKVRSELGTYSSGSISNSAVLSYQYAYDPVPNDGIPDDIPGIPDPDPTNPEDPDNPDPITTAPGSDSFTPATITISNVDKDTLTELSDGVYEISGFSEHNDSEDAGDTLTLANIAPGVYTIKQTGTKSGYFVDDPVNPKTIFVDKDGTVYEGNEANESKILENNTVIFTNSKTAPGFELPFTGTTATRVFTIAGICLMGGALFFIIIIFKKRDEDEEEKENA